MTKDEQIESLVSALEAIRDDYAPWHGEDAVEMMYAAHDALVEWENASQQLNAADAEHCPACTYWSVEKQRYCAGCGRKLRAAD